MKRKVLILTYYWPPSGGAGVQRWLKFARYLPDYGWEPVILTVDPDYAAFPVTDHSLSKEVPPGLSVFKTQATDYFRIYGKNRKKIPSAGFAVNADNSFKGKLLRFVRGNFFIPDPRKGWNPHAFKKACELINKGDIQHIITTSPPHSTQLIGIKLKKKYPSLKWLADLRDPWTDIYYYNQFYPTPLSKLIDRSFEKNVLKKADKIITVGESLKEVFSAKVAGLENKISVITNGFDEEDFHETAPEKPQVFTITYVGTLADIYPLEGFLDALILLRSAGNKFILRFTGSVSANQEKLIRSKLNENEVEFIPYVDHAASIKYMQGSSALLLIIPDHESNRSIITGKIFEYLASLKPVICLGPVDGDAAGIIKMTGHGMAFFYNEISVISDYLSFLIEQNTDAYSAPPIEFNRRELTRKLSACLNE